MTEPLKALCKKLVGMSEQDLLLIDKYFKTVRLKRKQFLIEEGQVYDFIGFVSQGAMRHFSVIDGDEKTCSITFENGFFADFESFYLNTPTVNNSRAMEDCVLLILTKSNRDLLLEECPVFERFQRIISEWEAQQAASRASFMSWEKPEERYLNLLRQNPQMFQRVPLKYIASLLGISPESLSRIRKRLISQPDFLTKVKHFQAMSPVHL